MKYAIEFSTDSDEMERRKVARPGVIRPDDCAIFEMEKNLYSVGGGNVFLA